MSVSRENPDFTDTGIVSVKPLVSYTKRHLPTPLGIVAACPELFREQSLHFVAPCWALNPPDIDEIVRELQNLSRLAPKATVIVLASTDHDVHRLSAAGVHTILVNHSIFVDERIFRPLPPFDIGDAGYDAIYNARFEPYKRHELARAIKNPAFIYDAPFTGDSGTTETAIRALIPNARYLNHEHGHGLYVRLESAAVAHEINRARTGLCLSSEEGIMRSSMEYLLCGVPVISTKCRGGRERYYQQPFALTVADDADAIGDAVADMARRRLNKLAVRNHIGKIVEFERGNFLRAANAIVWEIFGIANLFSTVDPFIRAHTFVDPSLDWSRERLEPLAAYLGVALAPRPLPGYASKRDAV